MRTLIVAVVLVLTLCGSALALNFSAPGYKAETYATYSGVVWAPETIMADNAGNLYLAHPEDHKLWKVAPGGAASVIMTTSFGPSGGEWTGGTSYGDYLYVASGNYVRKVSANGTWTNFTGGLPAASEVGIDRTGNYGGYMYVTTGGQDHIYRVDTSGNASMWSNWPGWTDNGGPIGLDFDTHGNYGGAMYVASYFGQNNADKSGLFIMDTAGNATRFSNDIVQGYELGFDTTGKFGYKMFVVGSNSWSSQNSIWQVNADGSTSLFATSDTALRSLTFGLDGAMYICDYAANDTVNVYKVVPEPATLLLLGIGASLLRRRNALHIK